MAEVILAVMLVALALYTVLGGADFGAGAIEGWLGVEGEQRVDVALSPVWEANHVWLVLLAVLAMVGFPPVYTAVTTYLHIPLYLALLGIVARGTAFTFRHYDPGARGGARAGYTRVFRYSSWLTPFFLGVVLAATSAGTLRRDVEAGFYAVFVAPGCNAFCLSTGLFVCVLFGFEAAALLAAEFASRGRHGRLPYRRLSRRLHLATMGSGALVFAAAWYDGVPLLHGFMASRFAWVCLAVATAGVPVVARAFETGHPNLLRVAMGAQSLCVLLGFFAAQFPIFVRFAVGPDVGFPDAAAPAPALRMMLWALGVGLSLILPGLAYLLRVYKRGQRPVAEDP